jgi:1-phosphofructokinase
MKSAPHIFTLTGNLLAERTLEFARWAPGKTQRATRETFQVGGKGINVSKMLNRLRVANTALCFTGGASGAECEAWLRTRRFNFRSFANDTSTRIGSVIRSAAHPETTFLGPDAAPSRSAIVECASFLDAQPDGQVLAICGSFPGWMESYVDVLRNALVRWLDRGVLVVDTYGPPLEWFSLQAVALAKMNAVEFTGLTDQTDTLSSLSTVARSSPVQRWVISDGPANVIFCEKSDAQPAILYPPKVDEISATGSGDVLFASLLHGLFGRQLSLSEALKPAIILAAANAAHAGVAEFPEPPSLQA